uniref:SRCR domain-containing protein n=1 Tax=Fundulus heteroclitus TaxID=8078 RepID=A0A3Q2QGR7_FUNHE
MPHSLICVILVFGINVVFPTEHIRLAGSNEYCSGRVEIYHNGVWGTVCDDYFDYLDAEVVCKQLGCGRPSTVHASAYFGEGTGEIWLDNVGCSGNEASLSQCSHSGFGSNNCEHSEDVGVTCTSKPKHNNAFRKRLFLKCRILGLS